MEGWRPELEMLDGDGVYRGWMVSQEQKRKEKKKKGLRGGGTKIE